MTPMVLADLAVGPVGFDEPKWLVLAPVLWALTAWIGRRTLSGLGTPTRRLALAIRLIVIALVVGALAEPDWRRKSENVALTVILDASQSVPGALQSSAERYIDEASAGREPDDRLGVLTVARDARVHGLPSQLIEHLEPGDPGRTDATNLGDGVQLALAVRPEDAAYRLVLVTDGNETSGSLLQAALAAKAAGVPVDVLPLQYTHASEVIVENLHAPPTARMGQPVDLRATIRSTTRTSGRVLLEVDGEPVDLDPGAPGLGLAWTLEPGINVVPMPITLLRGGPNDFRVTWEPEAPGGDSIAQNNTSEAVTFVSGQGHVLVVSEDPRESRQLVEALTEARIETDLATGAGMPHTLTDLNGYEAVVLVNEPAWNFSEADHQNLRQFVHDSGGGLVMVGGPNSFGAGGWIGTTLEDALPIRLDPPQKRQMPRGALVMVMHSVEIPNGVYFGKQTCSAAVDALSRLDLAGIVEYSGWGGGTRWVHPLSELGDKVVIKQRINQLQFGDMPDFGPSMQMAYNGLVSADAGQKHVIVISDGDPSRPSATLMQAYRDAGITISTVAIGVHGISDQQTMQWMADQTGGRFYEIKQADVADVVQVFVKEAQTVKRALIWEGTPFSPVLYPVGSPALRGINGVPPIGGYIVAADREGLSLVTMRGKEEDPILAQWQYGLGRVVTFTSDATNRWASAWTDWPGYEPFWSQHVRWAMRPTGNAQVQLTTRTDGDETVVTMDVLDAGGDRLNFASFTGRVAGPDGAGQDLNVQQIGPGRYQARFRSDQPGAHVIGLRYAAPSGDEIIEGSVQAAVTRPFSDEFRLLEDNRPLLEQVANLTGGRVLPAEAGQAQLWTREGLTMPVTARPIWMLVAIIGIGLFLLDVAVRRVRIEPAMLARAWRRMTFRAPQRAAEQMQSLRTVREKARARLGSADEQRAVEQARQDVAATKFEATPDAGKPTAPIVDTPDKPAVTIRKKDAGDDAAPEEDAISRLRRARQRAREEFDEQE